MGSGKVPEQQSPEEPAAADPRQSVAAVLDLEIAQLRAQVATLEKQGADETLIEHVRDRLRLRAIQRVALK